MQRLTTDTDRRIISQPQKGVLKMPSMTDRKAELWIGWTRDAARNYAIPEEFENLDDLVDDMADVATAYADEMLDQFEERFDTSSSSGRKRPEPHRRRASPRKKSREEDGESEREGEED